MESPITMGEAGDNVCKEKTKHADDGACVNGDINCDEQMEVCEIDSKAPEVNSNNIDSLKNCEKVPENKVPIETVIDDDDDDEPMEVDPQTNEKENCISDDDIIEDAEKDAVNISQNNGTSENHDDEKEGAVNGDGSENSVNGTTIILDDNKSENDNANPDSEQLNDSGDVVLIENDSEPKENGDVCSSPDIEEIINISDKETSKENNETINLVSPATKKKTKKSVEKIDYTPRRSSRNLNRQKSYVEKEEAAEKRPQKEDAESDIEEVTPEDPLAMTVVRETKEETKKKTNKTSPTSRSSSTIVVSDTKRLVEIAANSKPSSTSGKKEPTLVIIDTNSILSGRGPVPVTSHKSNQMSASFSMVPVALPAQGVYPPNMRATITPIPMASSTQSKQSSGVTSISNVSAIVPSLAVSSASVTPATPILPTLTDDMYVVEAPSFIVPYVYEKPPIKPFKEFVTQIHKELKELARQEAEKNKEEDDEDDEEESNEKSEKSTKKKNDKSEDAKSVSSDKDDNEKEKTKDGSSKKGDTTEDEEDEDDDDDDGGKANKKSSNKKKDDNIKTIDLDEIPDEKTDSVKPKSSSYFDNALGQFFINIGYGLVQEYVQTDLLKQQKRKQKSEGQAPETLMAINSLIKNLEYSKENNEPYRMEQKRCEFCSFKTESDLVLAHHLETPHMRNYVYKCNFCTTEVRSPHDILFHMEAEHNTRGRLERAPAFHQCPNCPFEDNQKGKLSRHSVTCLKKFKPECNLAPPIDWEPPAKIPRVPRMKQQGLQATAATYQALAQAKGNYQLFSKLQQASSPQSFPRGRGRPSLMGKVSPIRPQTPIIRTNMMYRPGAAGGSVLVPTTYQFGGNQIFQNSSGSKTSGKVVQQPSISITPLPRQSAGSSTTITKTSGSGSSGGASVSVTSSGESSSSKATFVICEICDGYIKDLEQLRNHMQWIHKVKIHPKMIYNRPPLNCQKCQFRFFTDQGLERHLLGSHGLVTSSMQEAANKSKDAGRCPVCGRVYQWKLLNHVARDHNMTLKPAHLSYKCTVCTATFGMYKQFENHVYSAHSVVAKRVMDKKSSPATTTSSATSSGATISSRGANDSLLKPLKINDEITIIPQPAKSSSKTSSGTKSSNANNDKGK